MIDRGRARIIESVAISATIGFMAVVVAAAALFLEQAESSAERAAITRLFGGSIDGKPARFDDQFFSRVYLIRGASQPYAAVLSLPSDAGRLQVAVLFSRDGAVRAIKPLGTKAIPQWLAGLTQAPSTRDFPASNRSLIACEDAVARASAAVSSIAEAQR